MGLKSTLKLLLLFCTFNLFLNQETYYLNETTPVKISSDNADKFVIEPEFSSKEYISIVLTPNDETKKNPSLIVALDSKNCNANRIAMSAQYSGNIYIFLKKDQIEKEGDDNNVFIICTEQREGDLIGGYSIEVKITEIAELPIGQQTSYFVDAYNTNMKFNLINPNSETPSHMSIYVKGKSIAKSHTSMNSYTENPFDSGKVFYYSYDEADNELTVESTQGDYVIVGSVPYNGIRDSINKLTIRGNEMTVYADKIICFPIDFKQQASYITGKLYTLKGSSYFIDSDKNLIGTKKEIKDGIISDYNIIRQLYPTQTDGFYCVELENSMIILSIQMLAYDDSLLLTTPAIPGEIRRYILKEGEKAVFSGIIPSEAKKESFNMKAVKGSPELYYTLNSQFPTCKITEIYRLTHPIVSNRFATYIHEFKSPINPIQRNQPVVVVDCPSGNKAVIGSNDKFCEVEITIFSDIDVVNVVEEGTFTQFLDEGEQHFYNIKIPSDIEPNKNIKIYLDLTIFSGDSDIKIVDYTSGDSNNYYLPNKVFYYIKYDKAKTENLRFNVEAKKNTFYMVNYIILDEDNSEDKNSIDSGVNYITLKTVSTDNVEKAVYLKNTKYEDNQPFMATFYSPNCKFSALWKRTTGDEIVPQFDNYASITIDKNYNDFSQEIYQFNYRIIPDANTDSSKSFCMVAVSGLELPDKTLAGRSISLEEGVPHTFTYSESYPLSNYSYFATDYDSTFVVDLHLLDRGEYMVYTIVNNVALNNGERIYRTKQLSISSSTIRNKCKSLKVCKIDINVLLIDFTENSEKKIQIRAYQLDANPLYLEKNRVTSDFLDGTHKKHYYFDISNEEYGDITLDFKRGSGNIYAKIVRITNPEIEENPDWRGVYKFPDGQTEIEYSAYGKKLSISKSDTMKCISGCYVLITVNTNMAMAEEYDMEKLPFRINLNTRVIKTDTKTPSPKVNIRLNEFIIGDIINDPLDNRKFDYYQILLPYDSNEVIIDWQADSPALLITVGDRLPALNDFDFILPSFGDFVFKIQKGKILESAYASQTDSLKGIPLTLGIYANYTDSIKSSPYAFKIYMPQIVTDNLKIASQLIHIRSDQKVQCTPWKYDEYSYMCAFAVIFDEIDFNNNLVLYPTTNGKEYIKYGKLVKAEIIETNDINEIISEAKDIMNKKSTEGFTDNDLIYIENVDKENSYLLITLFNQEISDDKIEILSSTYSYENGMVFTPNPSTPQIFALKEKNIFLEFQTTDDLLINLHSIAGIGGFSWSTESEKDKIMYLRGRDDRLSLTTSKETSTELPKLNATSFTSLLELKTGFVFYITYYPRSYMDQLKPNSIGEIHYRSVNMPLNYFGHIGYFQSWTVNLNFYDIILKNKKTEPLAYENDLFTLYGTVVPEMQIHKARYDERLRPKPTPENTFLGKVDGMFGVMFIAEGEISRIMEEEVLDKVPYIFFGINNTNTLNEYETIGLEADVHSVGVESGYYYTPEGIYITGKLTSVIQGKKIYRLKNIKKNEYLRLEYSTNSVYVKFALTFDYNIEAHSEFQSFEVKEVSGRKVLNVQLKKDQVANDLFFIAYAEKGVEDTYDERLDYFVFKYLYANSDSAFLPIDVGIDEKITFVENENEQKITISFQPLKYNDVSYFIKAIYTEDFVRGETVNSIAMSESKGMNLFINVPETEENLLTYEIPYNKDVLYVKVMAMYGLAEEKLIYLYKPVDISEHRVQESVVLTKTNVMQNITLQSKYRIITAQVPEAGEKQKYQVKFENPELLLEYVKVEVYNEEGEDSPMLCFSGSDPNCMSDRGQISKGGAKSTEFFIKKGQFLNSFFLTVQCQTTEGCSYNITISKMNEAVIDHMGVFNYYVSEENKNMNFKFKNDFTGEDESALLTVYATGGKNIFLKVHDCDDDECIQHDFNGGAAILFEATNLEYYGVQVIAQPGDYISLGINFKKSTVVRELTPEMGETTGLLKKEEQFERVCYDLPENDVFYITGRIYDGKAKIIYKDSGDDEVIIPSSKNENGFFYAVYNYNMNPVNTLCISLDKQDVLAYSVQIQAYSTFNGANFLPQVNAITYSRIIPIGKTITLNSLIPKTETNRLVFNMIAKVGYPKMYTYDCDSYPLINVDDKDIENSVTKKVSDINGISTISTTDIPESPIDSEQKLVVFKCHESKDNTTIDNYQYCEVLVTIFGESELIKLTNKQPFGKYNMQDDVNHYLIDFSSEEERPTKVFIDFLVVTGDVGITILNDDTNEEIIDAQKYYLSNKIFYSVPVNEDLKAIRIETTSRIDSYYIVEYKLITAKGEETTINYINSGINYLIPVEADKPEKTIVIESLNIIPPSMFFSSFYSLNCKFEITGEVQDSEAKIDSYGSYSQSVYEYKENEESKAKTFTAKIKEKNLISENDICMLYVSGLEFYKTSTGIRKEILIGEGIPQKTIFTETLKKIRYVFPHVDPSKKLTCSLNMIVPGKFGFRIFFREQEFNFDRVYSQSGIFFLKNDTIQQYCQNYELCSVTIEIENLETFNNESPIIEFSMKQEYNTPYYVERKVLRKDYVTNDAHLFLYTDVGKEYSGYATIDFNRGSGYCYGKIVKKDQSIPDENPHWRNYRFIKYLDEENSLEYDFYNKKIKFSIEDTEKCDNGCFLLISVVSSVIKTGNREYDFSPFSILIDFSPETYFMLGGSKVDILPDEFIIGSLYSTVLREEYNIQNYSLICPYDAEAIEIDWQTNVVQLNAEIDGYSIEYTNNGQSVIVISKEMIYGEEQKDDKSLKDKELKLRVSTQYFETHKFSVYSFRVHFRRKELNIHKATSDQKILCKPEKIETGDDSYYRCLLAVIYKDTELFNDLMVYAKSQDPSSKIDMFGTFIEREIYDGYNVEELQRNIPVQGAQFDTKATKTNFLFIKYGDFDKHVFISIVSNTDKDIEILTSFMTLEILLEPNPRSPQIYPIDLNKQEIHINFLTKQSLALNLMSLHGEAKVTLEQDSNGPFYLRGDEDNLKYIVKSDEERVNTDLTVENLRFSDLDYQNPGCAFILEFFLRIKSEELDTLTIGQTTEFGYQNIKEKTDLYYYAKVTDKDKDVTAFFYLHDLIYTSSAIESRTIKGDEFVFKAMVLPESRIFDIKNDKEKIPNDFYLQGVYDTALKAGSIYIPKTNFNGIQNPVILLAIRKNEKYHLEFERFRGEIGLNYINSDVPVIQNSYQLGKIEDNAVVNYKLKTDSKFSNYIRIQFSANSEYVDFAINQEKDQKVNGTFEEFIDKRERGITFVTVKRPEDADFLYLTIFLTSDFKNKKLNNYIFKYMNAEYDSFYEFKINNNNPRFTATKENGGLNIKFYTINTSQIDEYEPNIIYTVKLVDNETYVEDEKTDMIAITESPSIAQQFNHPTYSNDVSEMNVRFKEPNVNYTYAQIIATITKGSYVEYVTYQAIDMDGDIIDPESNPDPTSEPDTSDTSDIPEPTSKPKPTDAPSSGGVSKKALIAIIVVSCFLFIVVVVLVVVIVMYNSKNKDLLTQVNKISFVQSGASAKDDANLLLDNQNELD